MKEQEKVVILRRKSNGLSKIGGINGGIKEYETNSPSRVNNKGEYKGLYKGKGLPGAKHALHLFWSNLHNKYCWGGNEQILADLVKKMKLKHEKGHPDYKKVITEADPYDFSDPFFTHNYWCARKFLDEGRTTLNTKNPEDAVFYYSYKGNHKCHDKSQNLNDEFIAGAEYEIIDPKINIGNKEKDYKKEADATMALAKMSFEKQTLIAEIMSISTYDKNDPDPSRLFVSLMDECVKNESKVKRFKDKTGRAMFLELSNLSNEDLLVRVQVVRAKKAGILRMRNKYWQFNVPTSNLPDRIEVAGTDVDIQNFFKNENNTEYYAELAQHLEELEEANKR